MKTAISLPDELFERAEKEAARCQVSRSEFYRRALSQYLAASGDDEVTRKLNGVYDKTKSGVDPLLQSLQWASWADEKW